VALTLDVSEWATQQFQDCELGDRRRTKRLIKLAAQAANRPEASTPQQTETWHDCKAAYRLFAEDDVTFEAVIEPHCAQSRAVSPGVWLVINDTTEINFGCDRELSGVGRVGSVQARGFYLHSAMVVSAENDELVGIAGQDLYARPLKKVKRVSSASRKKLDRETDMWGRVIDRVGSPPEGSRWIHVCDRGADNFEIYCHLLQQRSGWVIRAAQLKRQLVDVNGQSISLDNIVTAAPLLGAYELQVQANQDQPARTAMIEVRATPIVMPRPTTGVSRYVRESGVTEIPMWAVDAHEVNPPQGVKPLRWVLLTSEKVTSFDDAWKIVGWYEKRPLIEEYHKCLKTGCSVEERQYRSGDRLAPVIALLSVLAMRLLQLKTVARCDPERPAAEVVPKTWLFIATKLRSTKQRSIQTVRDFIRAVAQLGGFLGRKGDGEPGWQTIWRGLTKLLLCLRVQDQTKEKCG
jgi:hypothetical protein